MGWGGGEGWRGGVEGRGGGEGVGTVCKMKNKRLFSF